MFTFFLLSCQSEEDCNTISTFTFVNNTSHIITIEIPEGTIAPNSRISVRNEDLGPCNVTSDNFVPPFLGETTVIFNNKKCLLYKSEKVGIGEGIIGLDNYVSKKESDNHYSFTYTFTEEDYSKAMNCK